MSNRSYTRVFSYIGSLDESLVSEENRCATVQIKRTRAQQTPLVALLSSGRYTSKTEDKQYRRTCVGYNNQRPTTAAARTRTTL